MNLPVQNGLEPEVDVHEMLDYAEVMLAQCVPFDLPTDHCFWGGFYIRQVHMPAGLVCTTKTHGKQHPFSVTKGKVEVCDNGGNLIVIEAPYVGITEAGTRRILRVLEDCTWTTFHATDAKSVEEAEDDLIINRRSPYAIPYANAHNESQHVLYNE